MSETSSLFASTPSWKSRETFIAIFTILMIAIHLLLRFGIQSQASTSNVPLIGVLVLSGIPLVCGIAIEDGTWGVRVGSSGWHIDFRLGCAG